MSKLDKEAILAELREGGQVDLCLSNGLVRSSKDCIGNPQEDGSLIVQVWHSISDCWETFSEKAFIEVLDGKRTFWDGDLTEEEEDDDDN